MPVGHSWMQMQAKVNVTAGVIGSKSPADHGG